MSKSPLKPPKERALRVIAAFEKDSNQWRTSSDIRAYIPNENDSQRTQVIYLMHACVPPLFEKRIKTGTGGIHEYRLTDDYKRAVAKLFPSLDNLRDVVQTAPPKTQNPEQEPQKRIHWTDPIWDTIEEHVRELRRKMPGVGILDAARQAQQSMLEHGMLKHEQKRNLAGLSTIQPLMDRLYDSEGRWIPDDEERQERIAEELREATSYQDAEVKLVAPTTEPVTPPATPIAVPVGEALPLPALPPDDFGGALNTVLTGLFGKLQQALTNGIADGIALGLERGLAHLPKPVNTLAPPAIGPSHKPPAPAEPVPRVLPASLAEQIVAMSETAVQEADKAAAPKPPKHNPEPPETGERRPKILIVGLYPDEVSEVQKEFGTTFALRYWQPHGNHNALKVMAQNAAHAFILRNRIFNKGQENLVTRQGVPYTLVTGNVDSVKDALTAFYVNLPTT